MIVSEKIAIEHGLKAEEYKKICELLKRNPNITELGIFSAMWNEHCSYKSSRLHLKKLPTKGKQVIQGPGENAGVIDIGDNDAIVFKIESHNHPSFIEPYQGAATGVGGIMRDVFTMGARPIANLNSIHFGSPQHKKTKNLLRGVVHGIGGYGNCMGIPTIAGQTSFDSSYNGNILVNAMTLGLVKKNKIFYSKAAGLNKPVIYVGSKTGRDGIHGATFASDELTEESESKKSNVQVGDPFTEKLLLEATLEMCKKDWLVGVQDMGAAGITCSSSEMSAKGKVGIKVDLDKVPLREDGMNAYEILLSESQERMLVVIKKGYEKELSAIYEKWDLLCCEIGIVTNTKNFEVYSKSKLVANIPVDSLVLGGDAPQYDMPYSEPSYYKQVNSLNVDNLTLNNNFNKNLITLLSTPNITNKSYVYNQYDSTVRTNTVYGPGQSAGVIRIKDTNKGLAVSTDCNGRYVYLNPKMGAKIAVAEAARNVVCGGGEPLAVTNCLNFGNPNDPGVYWQFKEAVTGMGEMCRQLNTPVTGGNVSFYNETVDSAVYPTPVIGMVGVLDNISQKTSLDFKDSGDFIVTLGALNGCVGGSEYLKSEHGKIEGPIPPLDEELELRVQELCLEAIKKGIIKSAHDLSDGGLAVNIAESIMSAKSGIGAKLDIDRKLRDDELLFGECQSVIIVSLNEDQLYDLILLAQGMDVYTQTIGRVTNDANLIINDLINVSRDKLEPVYMNTLRNLLSS